MRTTSIGRRYARATFEVAQQSGTTADWLNLLEVLAAAVGDKTILQALGSPNVSDEKKLAALTASFPNTPAELVNLLRLLIERHRMSLLPGIATAFAEYVDEAEGRTQAEVVSARTLADPELRAVEAHLTTRTGKSVRMNTSIDPSLIGGIILRVGDEVIDGSVATRLERLRQRMA